MSGARQHHIPQLLQRGFVAEDNPRQVVVYSKKSTFITNTKNYGIVNNFYTADEMLCADDEITKFESDSIAPLINHLRNWEGPLGIDKTSEIVSVISHLESRTVFYRQGVENLADIPSKHFVDKLSDDQFIRQFAISAFKSDELLLEKFANATGLTNLSKEELIEQVDKNYELFFEGLGKQHASELIDVAIELSNSNPERTKRKTIADLRDDVSRATKGDLFKDLSFRLLNCTTEELILPDTMVCFVTDKRLSPFLEKGNKLVAVLLPISKNKLLLGERRSFDFNRSISTINSMLASCANEAFIASHQCEKFNKLKRKIGKNAYLLKGNIVKKCIRDATSELLN